MSILYKYLDRKYVHSLLTKGEVKLGTLYEYRNKEGYGPARGDKDEGVKFSHKVIDELWTPQHPGYRLPRNVPKLLTPPAFDEDGVVSLSEGRFILHDLIESPENAAIHIMGNDRGSSITKIEDPPAGSTAWPLKPSLSEPNDGCFRISRVTLESRQECNDYYIYCTSMVFDIEVLEKGYFGDDCVVILDSVRFFAAISENIRSEAEFAGYYPCKYMSRKDTNSIHPALLKDPEYSFQKEVRALWEPRRLPIKEKIIECPDVRQYCRRFV